jgi:hypothetical protein
MLTNLAKFNLSPTLAFFSVGVRALCGITDPRKSAILMSLSLFKNTNIPVAFLTGDPGAEEL